ncbi:MAG: recombinase family protein [Proteobacteria bacterium]|jgi:DNA invertase Pin-like site-specific DNA recombinase|nr:recombinase family protein [Pseudomonadota bacterium]
MNKVALYARVSTDQQSTGLESQVRILKDYCAKNDVQNYELFTDEGISGTKSSRPALDRMMSAVNNGEISSVIVYSFSRFARSTTHLLNALQIYKCKNVSFVSITEKIDTSTPVGLAVFSILAAISQLERDLICERVKAGLANAKAKGRLIGRKKQRDSDLIRKLLKAGMTFRQIAQIAKCSHGSVWAEKSLMLKEEADKALVTESASVVFPEVPRTTPTAS